MIRVVSHLTLHDKEYPIYVFNNKELQKTITVKDSKDFATEILNMYFTYHADKIILGGNDLLTYKYEKEILKENKRFYQFNSLPIERINDN